VRQQQAALEQERASINDKVAEKLDAERTGIAEQEATKAMLSTMDDLTQPEWANPSAWAPFVLMEKVAR